MKPSLIESLKKGFFTSWFYASLLSNIGGRIALESLAGITWNQWPESNGITGRNGMESVAGIVRNPQCVHSTISGQAFQSKPTTDSRGSRPSIPRDPGHLFH